LFSSPTIPLDPDPVAEVEAAVTVWVLIECLHRTALGLERALKKITGGRADSDEVHDAAVEGLRIALEYYEPGRGKLFPYALKLARQKLSPGKKEPRRRQFRKIRLARDKLRDRGVRWPSDATLAGEADVPVQYVRLWRRHQKVNSALRGVGSDHGGKEQHVTRLRDTRADGTPDDRPNRMLWVKKHLRETLQEEVAKRCSSWPDALDIGQCLFGLGDQTGDIEWRKPEDVVARRPDWRGQEDRIEQIWERLYEVMADRLNRLMEQSQDGDSKSP
jgi:hypothetical protein